MLDKVSFLLWGHMQSVRADPFSVALYLLDSQNPCYNINKKTGDGGDVYDDLPANDRNG